MLFFQTNRTKDRARQIEYCSRNALNYILSKVNQQGGWSDFKTNRSGESTSWVTAYILNNVTELLPIKTIENAYSFLITERNNDGFWGFSKNIPSDLDSTINVLFALKRNDYQFNDEMASFIKIHQKENGGFSTYSDVDQLVNYRKSKVGEDFKGWLTEHICVSALTLEYLFTTQSKSGQINFDKALGYLIEQQNSLGYWESYWWRTNYYSTEIILKLLNVSNRHLFQKAIMKGINYIVDNWDQNGWWDNGIDKNKPCIISTSRNIKTLIYFDKRKYRIMVEKSLDWILDQQNINGDWENEPILRIPQPANILPNEIIDWKIGGFGVGSVCNDNNHLYTTASVLNILRKYK
ncbi:MAG: terpene cyclase/mutase family protein [Bacteroidetes bacterium]|nr:terpene cyclase/mutase family protein [Bacteroidota bacterium]